MRHGLGLSRGKRDSPRVCWSETCRCPTVGILCVTVLVTAFLVIPEGTIAQVVGRRGRLRGGERNEGATGERAESSSKISPASSLERRCEAIAVERRLTPARVRYSCCWRARAYVGYRHARHLQIARHGADAHRERIREAWRAQATGAHRSRPRASLSRMTPDRSKNHDAPSDGGSGRGYHGGCTRFDIHKEAFHGTHRSVRIHPALYSQRQ